MAVECEAVVLDCISTRQRRTLRYTNWTDLKIKGLLAGATPEVVMMAASDRLVAQLLSRQLNYCHMPLLL